MESRDPYMRGHSERVTDVAVGIARRIHLPESDLQILRTAGKLHDIGKITISDAILSKPERLSPSEWAEIHLHPVRGVEIVSPLKFLDSGLALIRNHHEKYDGSGYPDGISGESIPILARILTVADSFDAMTSNRPYRAPLSTEAAMSEIKAGAGTQFDPVIAKVFVDTMNR
jgi:HD-GYP domain-containing protein (c-di-GMP phosphodiesterase class II)